MERKHRTKIVCNTVFGTQNFIDLYISYIKGKLKNICKCRVYALYAHKNEKYLKTAQSG